jgi:NDP-4-keto-2,6-dideoxyhexose 3-C-methyltransferase
VSPELMYRHYWYRSVTNESMRRALADVAARAEQVVDVGAGDIVLDIGCNDGTLLRSYRAPGARLCGFEPAQNLVVFARQGTHVVINDFFNAQAFQKHLGSERAKVITTIAMFYDLDDPNAFVADIAACLHDQGVWINQMASLPLMLESNGFDNICHEHLEYYSLAVLVALYARHGLEVFDVETNDVNGGSFRVFARKRGATVGESPFAHARVASMLHYEQALGLGTMAPYQAFTARVREQRDALLTFLRNEKKAGKRIYGYGASTKGNTLLQYDGIGPDLVDAIADRNSEKWGRRTVASNIPIISEEQARADKPDYMLVLPWHFLPAFREREKDYLASGGRFIVPLPTTRIVSW